MSSFLILQMKNTPKGQISSIMYWSKYKLQSCGGTFTREKEYKNISIFYWL